MKICYLSDVNNPHTKKWCEYFRDLGHDVNLITFSNGNIDGVNVYCLNQENNLSKKDFFKISYVFKIFKVRKIIKFLGPDIIHAHYATSYGFYLTFITHPIKIISAWGTDIYEFPNKSFFHKLFLIRNLNKVDYLFSTSQCMAKEMKKYTNKEIFITPFGVKLDIFKSTQEANGNNIRIGTFKTLSPKYGIDVLIKAFKIAVDKTEQNIELYIAGKGELKEELNNLVLALELEQKVVFSGYLEGGLLIDFINSLDIVVIPSYFESFGVAAVEAQACSKPLIVSDAEGLLESTVPGQSSLVFKRGDVHELAEKILFLINNANDRKRLGLNGRTYVEENFDINHNFKFIESVYRRILHNEVK